MLTLFIWFLFLTRIVCTGPAINYWPVVNFSFDGDGTIEKLPYRPLSSHSLIVHFPNFPNTTNFAIGRLLLIVALLYHSVSVINQLIIHSSSSFPCLITSPGSPVSRFASPGCPFPSRLCLIADYRLQTILWIECRKICRTKY